MAKSKDVLPHRRRREKKTDYRNRLALLKSGKTRLVVRKSLSNMNVQFVNYKPEGDAVIASAFSQELKKDNVGWKYGCGNTPAAYLTGLLAGLRAKKANATEAIFDLGLQVSSKGSRLYAVVKGVLDAGVKIPVANENLPSDERILGKHIRPEIEENFKSVKEKILKESWIVEGAKEIEE